MNSSVERCTLIAKSHDEVTLLRDGTEAEQAGFEKVEIKSKKNNQLDFSFDSPYRKDIRCDLKSCGCRVNSFIWVSHDQKAIWFENPKVASRSIVEALEISVPGLQELLFQKLVMAGDNLLIKVTYPDVQSGNHSDAINRAISDFRKMKSGDSALDNLIPSFLRRKKKGFHLFHGSPTEAMSKYPSYFSFGFVRNPYEKMLSNYQMFTQQAHRKPKLDELFGYDMAGITLDEFLEKSLELKNHHWEKQVKYFPHDANGMVKLSFLGRLETIEKDWQFVRAQIDGSKNIGVVNNTRKQADSSSPTGLKAFIDKAYKEDMKLFFSCSALWEILSSIFSQSPGAS